MTVNVDSIQLLSTLAVNIIMEAEAKRPAATQIL